MWYYGVADAADPSAAVAARVAETESLRALRNAQGAPALQASAWQAAARGEIPTGLVSVEGVAARKAWGVALLSLDIASIWAGINDETQHPGFTALGHSELVSGRRCESGRHTLQFLPLSWVSDRWWVSVLTENRVLAERSRGQVLELTWQSSVDPSEVTSERGRQIVRDATPLGWSKGGWYLTSVDAGHTLIEYYTWSDPGGSVPAGMASAFAATGVRNQILAMDKFVRSKLSRCPVGG
jgi:hypothetical protein